MKQLFFLFGLSAISIGSNAQQQNEHQHTGNQFGVSVFANSQYLNPTNRADAGMQAKLSGKFPGWIITTDRWTGGFKDLNGAPIAIAGANPEEKARNLMTNQLSVAGINASEWVLENKQTTEKGINYLYFYQQVDGRKVAFTKMHFRFTADGKIARINMKGYGTPDASLKPIIASAKALEIAVSELDGAVVSSQKIEDLEWFPIPSENGYTLHPAYRFSVEGKVQESGSVPLNLQGYVDAISGALLYRDNETKDASDLKIVGSIFTDGYTKPTKVVGLPYVTTKVGATTILANDTGLVSSAFALPTTFNVSLEGKWSTVKSIPDANATPSFSTTASASTKIDSFDAASKSTSRHINAYYHVNTVHDFMKNIYGSTFTGMDYSLTTNVDVTGTCNAFFTGSGGSSINFFPASSGCVSFAEVRDIVYHEYGHAIVSRMYSGGMRNGALNEGQADVWAFSITKGPILGEGSMTSGSSIRRYDVAPKVYPKNIVGEVHGDGEIIAGIWWDYGVNVGNMDTMSKLFAATLLTDKPDGPNGTEGEVFYEMLISALINDDNDATLSNGTPHFTAIADAFARHGIYLLMDLDIEHDEVANQPKETPITVNAKVTASTPAFFSGINLVYRTSRVAGFVWDTVAMTDHLGGFTAQIPKQAEGTIVDYYFSAKDIVNYEGVFFPYNYYPVSVLPDSKVNLTYQFAVGVVAKRVFDFEEPLPSDWSIGLSTDAATSGKWIQAVPVPSTISSLASQTDKDHTSSTGSPSGKCLVTGNAAAAGTNAYTESVKNGGTTILTPFFDLSGYKNPIVEYYRWYGNFRGRNPKQQTWRVYMTTSGTIYRDVENTSQGDYSWRRRLFKPLDLFATASRMQMRFVASETPNDAGNGLVEAAIDDLVIYEGETVLGVKENTLELAKLYPNPASNVINIILPEGIVQNATISFYDITGKLMSTVPTTKGATHYAVDTKSMAPGQYMVVLQMDKTIQTIKVTVAAQ